MTIHVVKEDGAIKKFRRSNIIESLEAIGVERKTAKELAKKVHEKQKIREHEIKFMVFGMLDEIDPTLADRYYMTTKVHVKNDASQVSGNALLSNFLMEYLDLRPGDKIDVFHGNKRSTIRSYRIQSPHDDHETILMSASDMKSMDIRSGDQAGICKHS